MVQRVLLCVLITPALSIAQLPRRLEKCLPYPTFAQEIRQRQEEQRSKELRPRRIRIETLIFRSDGPLPRVIARRIALDLQSKMDGSDDSPGNDWPADLAARASDGWQHFGYFRAIVSQPRVRLLGEADREKIVAITVPVQPGTLYRLGAVRFSRSTLFTSGQIRNLFPIRKGEIFDTHKLSQGIEALRKAYGEQGFINFAAVPSTQIDESRKLVSFYLQLDEDKPFRVRKFEILGVDPSLTRSLVRQSGLAPGNIFNPRLLQLFFRRNKSLFPAGARPEDDTERRLNQQAGTVDLIIDLRGCPLPTQPWQSPATQDAPSPPPA